MLETNENGMYTITINGEDHEVDGDTLVRMAQKGEAADANFQKAAALKKELEAFIVKKAADLEIVDNLRKAVSTQDQEALISAVTGLGMPEESARAYLSQAQSPTPSEPKPGRGALTQDDTENLKWFEGFTGAARKAGINPEQFIQGIVQERQQKGTTAVQNRIKELLEKDPDLGRIMKKEDVRNDVLRVAESMLSHKFVRGEAQSLDETAISGAARDALDTLKRIFTSGTEEPAGGISLGGTPMAPFGFTGKPPKKLTRPAINANTEDRSEYLEQRLAEMISSDTHPEE